MNAWGADVLDEFDSRVRVATFRFLEEQARLAGSDVLPRTVLAQGFIFEGRRVPLMGPQGIFKPAVLSTMPLSITTVAVGEGEEAPYPDIVGSDGFLRYCYRGTDPSHRDNVGLRRAMQAQVPLAYFHGVVKGRYLAVWPVFVIEDSPKNLTFMVNVDDRKLALVDASDLDVADAEGRRRYVTRQVQTRLHQEAFRQRVIAAYQSHCAVCRLRHEELLEAAHILPDNHPKGLPVVPNGLALCKLHHGAFDANIIGIRPDYRIQVRVDILQEVDGPMLKHGLQGFHGSLIRLPRREAQRPNPSFLEERYASFLKAS